jgi:hypothetical protein
MADQDVLPYMVLCFVLLKFDDALIERERESQTNRVRKYRDGDLGTEKKKRHDRRLLILQSIQLIYNI